MLGFPTPSFMPCPECGASLPVHDEGAHLCDEERRLDYVLVGLRVELDRFERDLAEWLETPDGRFALWLARRERR